jgi:tetratricopeptide (TPR) repeat protein
MKIKAFMVALAALVLSTNTFAQEPSIELNNAYANATQKISAKEYAEAISFLEQTLELAYAEENAEYLVKAQRYIPVCYYSSGNAKVKAKNLDGALEDYAKAIELGNFYGDTKTVRNAKNQISKIYKSKGAGAYNKKNYAAAAEVFAKGYEANRQDTDLALYLAMSYCEMGDYTNGVKVYTDIIALESRHSKFAKPAATAKEKLTNYLLVKAQAENKQGNKEAAYATLETLVDAVPSYNNHIYRLNTAAQYSDWANLVAWGEEALAFCTGSAEQLSDINYLIAVGYDSMDENEKAVEAYKRVTVGKQVNAAKKRAVELNKFIAAQKAQKK